MPAPDRNRVNPKPNLSLDRRTNFLSSLPSPITEVLRNRLNGPRTSERSTKWTQRKDQSSILTLQQNPHLAFSSATTNNTTMQSLRLSSLFQRAAARRACPPKSLLTKRDISVGTHLPTAAGSASLQKARPWYNENEGSNLAADNEVTMNDLCTEGRTIAIFGVPAPFTGTCTNVHYPPYKATAAAFKEAGVDDLICYSVSDPYAHYGWGASMGNDFKAISFMADDGGAFAKTMGLDAQYDAVSLGSRSKRFSMLIQDGTVKAFHEVDDASKDADVLLEAAKKLS